MPSTSLEQKQNVVVDAPMYQALTTHDSEFDLITIMKILWQAKKSIISITLAFAIIGFALTFVLPQKWTSKAVVTAPEDSQLVNMRRMLISMQVLGVDLRFDSNDVFNSFIKKFTSQSLLDEYIEQTPAIKNKFKEGKVDQQELNKAVFLMAEKMKASSNDSNKNNDNMPYSAWTLNFTAPSSKEAQTVLQGYIGFISKLVVDETINNIRYAIELKISLEQNKLAIDRSILINEHNISIQRLEYALEVANAAGIKKPVYSNGQAVKDDPDFSIALGADGIAQKLQIEKSITDVSQLNPSIQNRETHLSELKKLNVQEISFEPFKYQMKPSQPVKRDSPITILTVLLAAILGFIIVSGLALLRNMADSRNK